MKKRIYIVDDEPKIGELFVNVLNRDGYDAQSFVSPQALLELVDRNESPDLILTDLMMPEMNGIELIESLQSKEKMLPVIIMTAHSSIQTAVDAMRHGAFHYLQKPVNLEEMRTLIGKALNMYDMKPENKVRRTKQQAKYPIEGLLGESPSIVKVREIIQTLKDVPNTTVLIRGETGTGKNLVAKTIHSNSVYNAGAFVEINCAALPDNLLEAELFGYEKGAFTDARDAKPGLLEVADSGTLFLDEIDSMSMALQAKLLSFLESRTFRRLGGVEELRVTTRIICATNAGLEESVAKKEFRRDLFYRINVVNLHLPPLRSMNKDLLEIAKSLLGHFNNEFGRSVKEFSPAASEKLCKHTWPGNVRQLRNVVERVLILSRDSNNSVVTVEELPLDRDVGESGDGMGVSADFVGLSLRDAREQVERDYLTLQITRFDGNISRTAEFIGMERSALHRKLKALGVNASASRTETR